MKAVAAYLAMAAAGMTLWLFAVISADFSPLTLGALIAGEILSVTAIRPVQRWLSRKTII